MLSRKLIGSAITVIKPDNWEDFFYFLRIYFFFFFVSSFKKSVKDKQKTQR